MLLLPNLRDPLERGDALCMAASSRFAMGSYAEALALASLVYEEMELNHWSAVLHAMSWRALSKLMLAEWDDVLDDVAAATTILRTGGLEEPPPFSCRIWTVAAFIHTARGRFDEADGLLAMLPAGIEPSMLISSSPAVALGQVRRGQLAEAHRRLQVIEKQVRAGDVVSGLARVDLAEVDGDWDSARHVDRQHAGHARPGRSPGAVRGVRRRAERPRGACRGDIARTSAPSSLDALEAWSRLGARWPVARVELALASAFDDDDPRRPRIMPDVRSRCSSRSALSTRSSAAAPCCRG